MKKKIVSFGEVLWDLFPEGERFGGAPANFACHAAILGAEVSMVSAVGDDQRGRQGLKILEDFHVDISLIQIVPDAPTGTVGVALDPAGKPAFTIREGSAWDRIAADESQWQRVKGADAVYFGTLGQRDTMARDTIRTSLSVAAESGVTRILDVNLRKPFYDSQLIQESIDRASVLKLSDDELATVCAACQIAGEGPPESQLRKVLGKYDLDLIVMTCGAEGAMVVTATEVVRQPGVATEVIDTVGAGDSFTASFTLGLLRGDSYADVLRKSCQVAASVCSQSGAVPR